MRKVWVVAVLFGAMSMMGCKKQVPTDIVQKSLRNAMRHAPATASAMCGANVRGLVNANITEVKRGKDNKGTAHVSGAPWLSPGAPKRCEGDVEFEYTYSQKTRGVRRKVTTTTWYLQHLRLVAVQTPGVAWANKPVDEDPDDDDDDDNTN